MSFSHLIPIFKACRYYFKPKKLTDPLFIEYDRETFMKMLREYNYEKVEQELKSRDVKGLYVYTYQAGLFSVIDLNEYELSVVKKKLRRYTSVINIDAVLPPGRVEIKGLIYNLIIPKEVIDKYEFYCNNDNVKFLKYGLFTVRGSVCTYNNQVYHVVSFSSTPLQLTFYDHDLHTLHSLLKDLGYNLVVEKVR